MSDANTHSGLAGSIGAALSNLPTPAELSSANRALLLLAPLLVFELLIFVVPFFILLRISFTESADDTVYEAGTWSLEAYGEVFTSGLLRDIILYSFQLGVIVTVLSVVIGLFYAYAIWRSSGIVKSLLLLSVVMPLLTTLVIRTYAFTPLLSPTGTLNDVLLSLGFLSEPVQFVPATIGAVVGQLYIVLPYAVLAIYSVMATMDWGLVEAARDLGASRPRSFFEVVLPQVMPGISVAAVISFAWSVGAYAAPDLLSNGITFAVHAEDLMLSDMRYSLAAALSVVMLLAMLIGVALISAVLSRFGGDFDLA
ncbi:ABC transporter permease [Halobiforma nitratireducens]|uniref:Binding-protein-dependent transport system inner membrane protein n=1 Tax=Halobiforma nitratireducens JCM 10879 TaxID=1227454 RepID=M0LFD2_9EURY|nr:ABC transporter permease [Halobiforma nitratireducens]EMA31134.1 binding-protein-dependent transport system inner membrane protein [Halobiforma nitratireducens JCM 10879]